MVGISCPPRDRLIHLPRDGNEETRHAGTRGKKLAARPLPRFRFFSQPPHRHSPSSHEIAHYTLRGGSSLARESWKGLGNGSQAAAARDRLPDHPSSAHPHCACHSSAIPLKLLTCLLDILLNAVSSMHSPSCPLHACTSSLTYCLFRQLDLIHLVRLFSIRSKLTSQEAVKAHPEEARMGVSRPTLKKYVWRPMQPRNADHKVPRRQVQDRHVLGH